MRINSISTKELRQNLPEVRAGLARGDGFLLIYRSKPIGRLEPIARQTFQNTKIKGGGLRLQANSSQRLTPAYLRKLGASQYE